MPWWARRPVSSNITMTRSISYARVYLKHSNARLLSPSRGMLLILRNLLTSCTTLPRLDKLVYFLRDPGAARQWVYVRLWLHLRSRRNAGHEGSLALPWLWEGAWRGHHLKLPWQWARLGLLPFRKYPEKWTEMRENVPREANELKFWLPRSLIPSSSSLFLIYNYSINCSFPFWSFKMAARYIKKRKEKRQKIVDRIFKLDEDF